MQTYLRYKNEKIDSRLRLQNQLITMLQNCLTKRSCLSALQRHSDHRSPQPLSHNSPKDFWVEFMVPEKLIGKINYINLSSVIKAGNNISSTCDFDSNKNAEIFYITIVVADF